ncbi:hypothetical protein AWB67_02406 [Caballeronia terrestris]|uniref:Uncharacterized protein n=1 Tax=Caballeronia terrestris TaxID=1226301 RepID=A0A158ICJ0_9BURK|nr:hypothetical protein [Caballeronia terrestris]SAL54254.1 hypothetical protein AWB67_02406 [Caballeronia terrestris]
MASTWQFQIRIAVSAKFAEALREGSADPALDPLHDILRAHNATLKSQFDAFMDYVTEAERTDPDNYPLYEWTRASVDSPEKKAKYLRVFTVYVDGEEIYREETANQLHAELTALAGPDGIERVMKFDTNPANNPQPPRQ